MAKYDVVVTLEKRARIDFGELPESFIRNLVQAMESDNRAVTEELGWWGLDDLANDCKWVTTQVDITEVAATRTKKNAKV